MVPSIFHSYPRVSSPPSGYPRLCHGSRVCLSARPLANGQELGRSWWLYNNPWHSYIFLLGMWWLSLIKHDIYSILRRAQIPSILGEKAPEQPCMDPKCFKPHPFASYGPMGCCLRRKNAHKQHLGSEDPQIRRSILSAVTIEMALLGGITPTPGALKKCPFH